MFKLINFLLTATLCIAANGAPSPEEVGIPETDFPAPDIPELNSNETDLEIEAEEISLAGIFTDEIQLYQNKRYSMGAFVKVDWYRAQLLCAAEGLHLATINTIAESKQLHDFLKENDFLDEDFWLSGFCLPGLNRWFWMSNGSPLKYQNWARNEPIGYGSNCLIKRSNGDWAAENCQREYYFICENRCPLDSYNSPRF